MTDSELKNKLKEIINILSIMNNKDDIYNFLRDLLSEKEIIDFSNRFNTAKMLDRNISYKDIENSVWISSTTIARISKYLNWKNAWYRNAINTLRSTSNRHHEGHQS